MTCRNGENHTSYFWWNVEAYPKPKDIVSKGPHDHRIY